MTSFRFTTLFGGGKGDVYNLFFQEEKSIVMFIVFSHREKKTHTQNNRDPFPSKNQPLTLPCLRGSTRSISTTTERLPNPVTLRFRPHKASQGVTHHPGEGGGFFFFARPNISTFKGRVFSKIYGVEVEV